VQSNNPEQFRGIFPADDGSLRDAFSPQFNHRDVERLIRMRQFEILADDLVESGASSIDGQRPIQILHRRACRD
jgi:hypothetical protein